MMAGPLLARPQRRRRARSAALAAVIGASAALGLAVCAVGAQGSNGTSAEDASGPVSDVLRHLNAEIGPMEQQVDAGHIVPKFGQRAAAAIRQAGPELERAADGMLRVLFLRQLALLRQQLAAQFEKAGTPVEAVTQADELFVEQAADLVRPSVEGLADWDVGKGYDQERDALRAALQGAFGRDAALARGRAQAAATQQSTTEVISKLQSQMETLQTKVANLRAGSPWFLSSSYRIPGTPVQLIGRWQQNRGSLEFSLSPDKDPANSEAGFVSGVGPANLGLTVNVGV